jgi:hypothetical protein
MRRILTGAALALGFALAGWAPGAQAAIVVTTDNTGTGNNVIFNGCSAPADSTPGDNVVQGCLNTNKNAIILFTADQPIEIAGGGQAAIEAIGAGFSSLVIDLVLPTAADLLALNIDIANGESGTVVFDTDVTGPSAPFALDDKGENKFTITTNPVVAFSQLSFTTSGSINLLVVDVKQVRLDPGSTGPDPIPVPEPATLVLFGLGLAGLGGIARARHRAHR